MEVLKEFYKVKCIDEKTYEEIINMIKARNLLSHDYNEDEFEVIYYKLPDYLMLMIKVIDILEAKKQIN